MNNTSPFSYPGMILIVLQENAGALEQELAEGVRQIILEEGGEAKIVEESQAGAEQADLVLLMSDCASYRDWPAVRGTHSTRPYTVLWQMHPLPPASLPKAGERLGLKAAGRPQHRSRKWGLGRFRHEIHKWIAQHRFTRCRGQILASPNWRWPELETASVRAMMQRWAVLKRWHESGKLDRICVSTPDRRDFLTSRGISADLVSVGWHPILGTDTSRTRELDVVFLGRLKRRQRQAAMERIQRELAAAGVKLTVVEKDCYGESREQLLNRAKVVLNLNKFPWDTPWIRLIMASSCGAAVVSEPLEGVFEGCLKEGEHYLTADPQHLAKAVVDLLADEPRRRTMVLSAQAWLKSQLTLQKSVHSLAASVSVRSGQYETPL